MTETYKIHVNCGNCEFKTSHPKQMFGIEQGITIVKNLQTAKCPNCGCNTLYQQS